MNNKSEQNRVKTAYTPDPNGLYEKYQVIKLSTGEIVNDCFVLRWPDPHAHAALRAYADSVRSENSLLANDLDALVMRLRVLPTPPEADRG